jgi:hypothetical protein
VRIGWKGNEKASERWTKKRRDLTALPLPIYREAAASSPILKKRVNQGLLILQDDRTMIRNKYTKTYLNRFARNQEESAQKRLRRGDRKRDKNMQHEGREDNILHISRYLRTLEVCPWRRESGSLISASH